MYLQQSSPQKDQIKTIYRRNSDNELENYVYQCFPKWVILSPWWGWNHLGGVIVASDATGRD